MALRALFGGGPIGVDVISWRFAPTLDVARVDRHVFILQWLMSGQ